MNQRVIKKIPKFKAFEIVNHLSLYEELSAEEKHLISDNQSLFYLIRKQVSFITEGELDNCFYLILSGKAQVDQNRI